MALGGIPLTILLHVIDPPGNLAGAAVMAYAAGMGIAIAEYGVRHPDEFPEDPER